MKPALNRMALVSIAAYALCSEVLAVLNKTFLNLLPYPSILMSFQLLTGFIVSSVALQRLRGEAKQQSKQSQQGMFEYLLGRDLGSWSNMAYFSAYVLVLALSVYVRRQASWHRISVPTLLALRSLSLPCLAWGEAQIMVGGDRSSSYPSTRAWTGLALVGLGASTLLWGNDNDANNHDGPTAIGYAWSLLYILISSCEVLYAKWLLDYLYPSRHHYNPFRRVGNFGQQWFVAPLQAVYYTSLLGLVPMLAVVDNDNELEMPFYRILIERSVAPSALLGTLFLLCCLADTALGMATWWCRCQTSATSFAVVALVNKYLVMGLRSNFWVRNEQQPTISLTLLCWCLCLGGAAMYLQYAPQERPKNVLDFP